MGPSARRAAGRRATISIPPTVSEVTRAIRRLLASTSADRGLARFLQHAEGLFEAAAMAHDRDFGGHHLRHCRIGVELLSARIISSRPSTPASRVNSSTTGNTVCLVRSSVSIAASIGYSVEASHIG